MIPSLTLKSLRPLLAGLFTLCTALSFAEAPHNGLLAGTVERGLLEDAFCQNDLDSGDAGTLLLYDAEVVAALKSLPEDDWPPLMPVAEVRLNENMSGDYEYAFRDVHPGAYHLAVNCEALPVTVASLLLLDRFSAAVAVFDGRLSEYHIREPGRRPQAEDDYRIGSAR